MLPRQHRLPGSFFPTVSRQGQRFSNQFFSLRVLALKSPLPTRFGVVVSAKKLPLAVDRNRLRRQLYHLIFSNITLIKPGLAVIILVLVPKPDQSLFDLFKQARIFHETPDLKTH